VIFLKDKTKALKEFAKLCKKLHISKNLPVIAIRTNHGREFNQDKFIDCCDKNDIFYNFLAPKIPQENNIVDGKNRTLEGMSKIVICEDDLPKSLWILQIMYLIDASFNQASNRQHMNCLKVRTKCFVF